MQVTVSHGSLLVGQPLIQRFRAKERLLNTMEMLREAVPFLVGLILPALTIFLFHVARLDHFRIPASFIVALVVGCCVSLLAGELTGEIEGSVMAVIIDTSLVYTGSQLGYHLLWKSLLEQRLARRTAATAVTTEPIQQ